MNLQGFDFISLNEELIIYIFKLLNFKDQLSLSCTCTQLYDCFVNFVVREPYKAMCVFRRLSIIAITNGMDMNSVILRQDDLDEFMKIYSQSVIRLRENCPTASNILLKFLNLTSYSLENRPMTIEQLKVIAKCCPNLQNLQMYEVIDELDLAVVALMPLKNLKRLTLKYSDYDQQIEYEFFRDFVCKLHLDALIVEATLVPSVAYTDTNSRERHLKLLTIKLSFDTELWHDCFQSFLSNFRNLTSFNFSAPDGMNDNNLRLVVDSCEKLKILTIHHTVFILTKPFDIPKNVSVFALEHCTGLKWSNFREVLSRETMTKFTTKCTTYVGVFEDFQISPNIESLYLEGSIYMNRFKSAYVGNTKLKELTWHEDDDCFYDLANEVDVPMEACPNLHTLILKGGFVPLGSLMQLMHLKTLTITIQDTTPLLGWSYITTLLRHPTLTDLTIDAQCDDGDCLRDTTARPLLGFPTNVKYLSLSCDIVEHEFNFWMDLFSQNIQLQISCQKFYTSNLELLEAILYHRKLPRSVTNLDIFGFLIRCQDLRNDFEGVTEKLVDDRMKLYPDILNINRIILRRGL